MATMPKSVRDRIVNGCDIALAPLLFWQVAGAPQPATMIITGVVLGVRRAVTLHKQGNGR